VLHHPSPNTFFVKSAAQEILASVSGRVHSVQTVGRHCPQSGGHVPRQFRR